MFKPLVKTLVLAAGLLSAAAFAHTDEYLDTVVGPNGGQLRMAGAYHFELVLAKDAKAGAPSAVKLYLLDHGNNPQPAKDAKATVLIVSGKAKAKTELIPQSAPQADNLLAGSAAYTAAEDLKAVVNISIKTEHGEVTEQAMFTPFKPVPAKAEAEHEHGHEHGAEHAHEDEKGHKH